MPTGADLVAAAKTRLDWDYEVDTSFDPVGRDQYRLTGGKGTTDLFRRHYAVGGVVLQFVGSRDARRRHLTVASLIARS